MIQNQSLFDIAVAPPAGAWIETLNMAAMTGSSESHPPRVRGLKQLVDEGLAQHLQSHPPRVRGLKPSW